MARALRAPGTLQTYVTRQAERRPQATAIVAGDLRVSYEALESRANRLARLLGLGRGDRSGGAGRGGQGVEVGCAQEVLGERQRVRSVVRYVHRQQAPAGGEDVADGQLPEKVQGFVERHHLVGGHLDPVTTQYARELDAGLAGRHHAAVAAGSWTGDHVRSLPRRRARRGGR